MAVGKINNEASSPFPEDVLGCVAGAGQYPSQISVTWTPTSEPSDTYNIYKSVLGNPWFLLTNDTSPPFVDTLTGYNVLMEYKIKAVNTSLVESVNYSNTDGYITYDYQNINLGYHLNDSAQACSATPSLYFINGTAADFYSATILWDNITYPATLAPAGFYVGDNGGSDIWREWNGTTFLGVGACP
jgi:hypothetical protein